ncbi:MAG: hypothetical protein ACP5SF_02135 [Thermoplasmata archaeon]
MESNVDKNPAERKATAKRLREKRNPPMELAIPYGSLLKMPVMLESLDLSSGENTFIEKFCLIDKAI